MIFGAEDRPLDYRFVETNPAFAGQPGLLDAVGRTARELISDLEAHWFEIYGQMALTGTPVTFVNEAETMDGRWFKVDAFRLGDPRLTHVAILFTDISERRRLEQTRRMERLLADLRNTVRWETGKPSPRFAPTDLGRLAVAAVEREIEGGLAPRVIVDEPGRTVARLSVKDQGEGIDPTALPRLFDRFYRADGSK